MKLSLTILGALIAIVGVIWALQGANLLGGSFMTNERQWLIIGVAFILAGIGVMAWANRP